MANRRTRRQSRLMGKARENHQTQSRKLAVIFGPLLLIGTIALYNPVQTHEFINYDDPDYVLKNPHVTEGFDWQTIRWSLTSAYASNWHPVTWWSHALDWECFAGEAGRHHETSALFHAINGLLLFIVLRWATQEELRSFVVAAVFSWHPFNVESVAWVAERKTLLCMFFSLLTILAYLWYTRSRRWLQLGLVFAAYVLALASKPMAVTLPFLLLLLDYWPLRRFTGWTKPEADPSIRQESISALILEKVPLFVLAAASCVVTIWAQRAGGAFRSFHRYPLGLRLANALDSYVIYIAKTLWPSGFGLFYPHPGSTLPLWKPILALVLIVAISVAVWLQRSTRRYLVVGWLWFLGTLVPVIGIVQVGDQARADRYAYLPIIGLSLMLVWGTFDLSERLPAPRRWIAILLVLLVLCWLSLRQIGYWKSSLAVWAHTLEVTEKNPVAETQVAFAFLDDHDSEQAAVHFKNAVDLDPASLTSRVNLGMIYASHGHIQEGIQQFETAVHLSDGKELSDEDLAYRSSAQLNLAFAEMLQNNYPKALTSLRQANQSASPMLDDTIESVRSSLARAPSEGGYLQLALLLSARGNGQEASAILDQAIATNPDYDHARQLLDFLTPPPNPSSRR